MDAQDQPTAEQPATPTSPSETPQAPAPAAPPAAAAPPAPPAAPVASMQPPVAPAVPPLPPVPPAPARTPWWHRSWVPIVGGIAIVLLILGTTWRIGYAMGSHDHRGDHGVSRLDKQKLLDEGLPKGGKGKFGGPRHRQYPGAPPGQLPSHVPTPTPSPSKTG
jgi:hypothetical protein